MDVKIYLFGILLVVMLSLSAVSAEDNATATDDLQLLGDGESAVGDGVADAGQEIKIVANDVNAYYSKTSGYAVSLVDEQGNPVTDANEVKAVYSDGRQAIASNTNDGEYLFDLDTVGNWATTIELNDSHYKATSVLIYVKISKAPVKITAKNFYSNTKQYTTLKAIVKDKNGDSVDEGTVRFKINGKSYDVKVKNGVAVKKIKLTKAKTYTYQATYLTNSHYKSSEASRAKAYVYGCLKKDRTFHIRGYKITINMNKYNKLIDAKNTGRGVSFEQGISKYITQKYRHKYSNGKYVYKTVRAKVMFVIAYGGKDGMQTASSNHYSVLLTTRYQFPESFCTPRLSGTKTSYTLNKLDSAKLKSY